MKFKPISKDEIQTMNLIKPGIYQFEVFAAENTQSRAGNDMIKLHLKVWDEKGSERVVFDYLLENIMHKLYNFSEITGMLDKYNAGHIMGEDCVGKTGFVELVIQKGREKSDKSGHFDDSNSVKKYLNKDKSEIKKDEKKSDVDADFDDDLPF